MKRVLGSVLLVAALAAGCNGGGEGSPAPSTGTNTPPTLGGPSPISVLTNGCHRTRGGAVELLVRFTLGASPLLGVLHAGEKLGFRGTIVEPSAWSTTGAPPATQVHPRSYINHILIPEQEPLPPVITFHVDVFLERVVPLSASALSGLVGKTDHGPFGDVSVSDVASKGGNVVVTLTLDGSPPSPTVYAALGPRSATLTQGGDHLVGTIAPQEAPVSSVQIQFHKPGGSGPVTLGLSDWTLSAAPQLAYDGAPGACGNV